MNKRINSVKRILIACIFAVFSQQIFAANSSTIGISIISISAICLLIALIIVLIYHINKVQKKWETRYTEVIKDRNDLKLQKENAERINVESDNKLKEATEHAEELQRMVSTLTDNKKEIEQFLVAKIKENDAIQRTAAEKQAEADEQIRKAGEIHDNFFVETIHEMRTPLSLVMGSLALVVQNKDPEKDMSVQLLSAYRNTLAIQDLADQLIGTRRTTDMSNYMRVARYDMIELVRQNTDLFVDWVAMNKIDFRINTQTHKFYVWLDRRKAEFALRMLLTNAFKNTFIYGKIRMDIDYVSENEHAYCSVSVFDEGLDETESARRGLKQISDMMEDIGGIYKKKIDKNGSTFTLLFRLGKQHLLDRRVEFIEPEADLVKLNERQKEDIAELIQIIPQKKDTGKKLLVVDDSDQIRWFLKHVFNKEYEMLEARNGEEGVKVATEQLPDLVLCDVMMPVKDGFETCREIKKDPRTAQIPVVMLTAKVENEDVITGIEAGADDYITKPFDIEILRSKISMLMKRHDEMKKYFTTTGTTNESSNNIPTNPFMDSVINTITRHLDDPNFEAKILADSLNMSLPTLYRKIKQYSDMSILELTRSIRLKKAADLLMTEQYSVQEVAEMVGFNDTATFRKRFTEQYGTTPSQYANVRG